LKRLDLTEKQLVNGGKICKKKSQEKKKKGYLDARGKKPRKGPAAERRGARNPRNGTGEYQINITPQTGKKNHSWQ